MSFFNRTFNISGYFSSRAAGGSHPAKRSNNRTEPDADDDQHATQGWVKGGVQAAMTALMEQADKRFEKVETKLEEFSLALGSQTERSHAQTAQMQRVVFFC